jgi:ABC-2 type transport system ATP-binding protein
MIELSSVTRKFGRASEAVSDVTLSLRAGCVWALVGPNGAGKSTLLSLILGFIRPTRGTVLIAGDRPRDYVRDCGASYLPERFSLPSSWRAGDALRMFAQLDGSGAASAARVIDRFGLEPHLHKRSRELARGLLQRVGLAQALIAERDLIVLDEPTEGLDPVWRVRLRDIVNDLRAENRTIVIASHDLAELERVADRVIVLDAGRVREVLEVQPHAHVAEYRVRLADPFQTVHDSFPDARAEDERTFITRVADAAELSQRLGALLASGAIVSAVEPLHRALEERVRAAIDGSATERGGGG